MIVDDTPTPKVCVRCAGSGIVANLSAEDFTVEDSYPRESGTITCPACGGVGFTAEED